MSLWHDPDSLPELPCAAPPGTLARHLDIVFVQRDEHGAVATMPVDERTVQLLGTSLDPAAVRDTLEVLRAQRANRPLTLIATDNRADALGDGCDRVAVLERGRLIFDGAPAALDAALPDRLDLRYVHKGRP
jgi:hypothetical protein